MLALGACALVSCTRAASGGPTASPGKEAPIAVANDEGIAVAGPIYFYPIYEAVAEDSRPVIEAVAEVMKGQGGEYCIEGHVGYRERGTHETAAYSRYRASTVLDALVAQGVPKARLTAVGCSTQFGVESGHDLPPGYDTYDDRRSVDRIEFRKRTRGGCRCE